jgi:chlorophyll synthase
LELLKPITWFPPMWAFLCGTVSSGVSPLQQPLLLCLGLVLTGPLVCGASQVVNDWFDREVDAINEPDRPIPSGRVPGAIGLYFAIIWSLISLAWAGLLGTWVLIATALALLLAWAYSAPPLRLKLNGWWGNAAVGFSYEGLAWVTGAAVMLGGQMPPLPVIALALLYSLGAHGIMTLNDFKSIDGDRRLGIRSIPARYGARRAAQLACAVMIVPQVAVIALLMYWSKSLAAASVLGLLLLQVLAMIRLLRDPRAMAPWYNATGVSLYVLGMLCSAYAIGSSAL